MKDYQQKRMKSFLLPEAVYRQALWAVKDLPRLKEALEREGDKIEKLSCGYYSDRVCDMNMPGDKDYTGSRGTNLANLSMKIEAIELAFYEIPSEYRQGLKAKLVDGKPYDDKFHNNTWKKWQQVYIFHVAKNLGLY